MKQLPTDCFNKRMIRLLSSDAWAALTAGISTVPIELHERRKKDAWQSHSCQYSVKEALEENHSVDF